MWDATAVSIFAAVGRLDTFLSLLAAEDCFACFWNSAIYSWVNLDFRPTLLKGFVGTDDEEREEKPVLIRSSVFSLRSEAAL